MDPAGAAGSQFDNTLSVSAVWNNVEHRLPVLIPVLHLTVADADDAFFTEVDLQARLLSVGFLA